MREQQQDQYLDLFIVLILIWIRISGDSPSSASLASQYASPPKIEPARSALELTRSVLDCKLDHHCQQDHLT